MHMKAFPEPRQQHRRTISLSAEQIIHDIITLDYSAVAALQHRHRRTLTLVDNELSPDTVAMHCFAGAMNYFVEKILIERPGKTQFKLIAAR